MKTLTIEILDEKAIRLLHDLELLNLIKVRKEKNKPGINWPQKYKGQMSKQRPEEINAQLKRLRSEWE